MLDQLFQIVKENAQDLIVNNSAVPNQFNDAAMVKHLMPYTTNCLKR
ncbi:MAG: hypothetical protein IPH78_01810 [Bacteroidetes bacterium]|nr:hypothetical protein [Bacteroidota bacterium]